jgi:hypothetical protein
MGLVLNQQETHLGGRYRIVLDNGADGKIPELDNEAHPGGPPAYYCEG